MKNIEEFINHVEQLKYSKQKDVSYLGAFESTSIDLEIIIEDLLEASKFVVVEIPSLDKDNIKYIRQLNIYSESLLGVFSMDFEDGLLAVFSTKTKEPFHRSFLKTGYGEIYSPIDAFNNSALLSPHISLVAESDEDDL